MGKKGKILKLAMMVAGILFGLMLIAVIILLINYPAEYLRRVVTYQMSDVYDYQIFPERAIQPASTSIPFKSSAHPKEDEARVKGWLEQDPLIGGNLDTFFANTRTQVFLVIQDNTVIYENNFNGLQRNSIVTTFSVAKSFVSSLVSIAIAEGKIKSLEDPITRYLPELLERDPRFSQITLHHLLDMTSGIRYFENGFINGDDAIAYYYPDLRELGLRKLDITGDPGKTWLYNNYNLLLVGMILERTTGIPVANYLETRLWQPMGAEYPASWSLDSSQTGFEKMLCGINARPIDFAKLGRLYLDGGKVNGQQIVPEAWIQQATRIDPTVDRAGFYPAKMNQPYGQLYHQLYWWGVQEPDGSYGYEAQGSYGQHLFVYPEKRIIIVRNGEISGITEEEWIGVFMAFAKKVNLGN